MNPTLAIPNAKILVADDSRLQREMLELLLKNVGCEVIIAKDGSEAVDCFIRYQPDLVLLDIMMPKKDGIQAAKEIITLLQDNYVPIVFITSMDNEEVLNQCVAAGGDDFILKPYNAVMLTAKINSLLRVKRIYGELRQQKQELLHYQELFKQEQQVAASLYKNILHADFVESSILRYSLSPMALFNGDILLTAKAPGNRYYVLLGDFTGHGLSASIGAEPTAQIFYGMARKGFSGVDIIKEMNRKLHRLLPVNMFLAATMVTLCTDSSFMEIITCGLPAHHLLHKPTNTIRNIESKNVPLGIISNYEPKVEYYEIDAQDYLYLYTDGVIEAQNVEGQQFDVEGVMTCLEADVDSHFDVILENLQRHTRGLEQQDDVTFVELHCDLSTASWREDNQATQKIKHSGLTWNSHLQFEMETLQLVNPIPIMMNMLMDIQGLQRYQEAIYCIVNELYLNALDYGLLQMDGSLKRTPEGLLKFQSQRNQRLQEVKIGAVDVDFQHRPTANGGCLTVTIKDTGIGFDTVKAMAVEHSPPSGISRVNTICRQLQYFEGGCKVQAVFEWNN